MVIKGGSFSPTFIFLGAFGLMCFKVLPSNTNINDIFDVGVYTCRDCAGTPITVGYSYGVLLVLPYRQATGNTTVDFAVQLFFPNGDYDPSLPYSSSFYYRSGQRDCWNQWLRIAGQ